MTVLLTTIAIETSSKTETHSDTHWQQHVIESSGQEEGRKSVQKCHLCQKSFYYTNNLGDQRRELLCPIKMTTRVEIPRSVFEKKQAPTRGTELAGFVRDSKRYEARPAELPPCGVFSKEKLVLGY